MPIHVTPIPTLIEFATPSITIGATAAAGDAETAIRSNSTIQGVALVASTVDESIARFAGTAGQLQGYSSNAPTISDAGVISLTSGQLKFPATVNPSADANTLDDYEIGTWTPSLQDGSGNAAGVDGAAGWYTRIGDVVSISCAIDVNSTSGMTTGNAAIITGLPFTAANLTANGQGYPGGIYVYFGTNLNLSTAGGYVTGDPLPNGSYITLREWSSTEGVANSLTVAEVSADGVLCLGGQYRV
jgi:hypothetical protein